MELADILGEAYRLDQVSGAHSSALALLKDAFTEDAAMGAAARTELSRLDAVVKARQSGDFHGDHVSKVCRDLLAAALAL